MKKLREVLLTQSIGAITVGFIVAQTVVGAIGGLVQIGVNYYWARHQSSALMNESAPFPWINVISWLVTIFLELLTAFLLMRWLYAPDKTDAEASSVASPEANEHE
jgi:TRAP-type C4-dicarboxylate transport system permease large subunit